MRIWIKAALALAAIAAMLWLIVRIGSFTLDILAVDGGASGSHDPQFAEPAETAEPFEVLTEEEETVVYKDNSANWDISVNTPVDQTADELAEEEKAQN